MSDIRNVETFTFSDLFPYELKVETDLLPYVLLDELPPPPVSQLEGSSDLMASYHNIQKKNRSIRASGLHAKASISYDGLVGAEWCMQEGQVSA